MRKPRLPLVLGALALGVSIGAFAQHDYPNHPVTAVITFPPGSATDIVGRIAVQKLSEIWGQPVVPDNRSGAGGVIGAQVVARAAPDGYTLLVDSTGHAVNPSLYAKLPYDTFKDFVEIAPLAIAPNVLVVSPDSPYKSLKDLVDAARKRPGSINFASAGVGSGTHLNLLHFMEAAQIKVTHVPFKGTPEVLSNLMNHSVDCYWAPISAGISSIRGGKLRPLAVSTSGRSSQLPDVPTTAEAGVKDAESPLWFGIWGPAGMPKALVDKIAADIHRAMQSKDVVERLAGLGTDPMDMSTDEFGRFVRKEAATYEVLVKKAGIKPQ
jgi:tripartite-type tricarboxylate transporter receptor subunit TctC